MVPKLVAEDIPLLHSLLTDVFPGIEYSRAPMKELRAQIVKVCQEMNLVHADTGTQWMDKVKGCWYGVGVKQLWYIVVQGKRSCSIES